MVWQIESKNQMKHRKYILKKIIANKFTVIMFVDACTVWSTYRLKNPAWQIENYKKLQFRSKKRTVNPSDFCCNCSSTETLTWTLTKDVRDFKFREQNQNGWVQFRARSSHEHLAPNLKLATDFCLTWEGQSEKSQCFNCLLLISRRDCWQLEYLSVYIHFSLNFYFLDFHELSAISMT